MADRLGVRQQTVAKWESGENRPTVDNTLALADVLTDLDPLLVVLAIWPALAASGPLAALRLVLLGASAEQVTQVEAAARRITSAPLGPGAVDDVADSA